MPSPSTRPILALPLVLLAGCFVGGNQSVDSGPDGSPSPEFQMVYTPDLPVGHPPYDEVPVSWKQRMEAHYVYFEHFGSYTETGALIPALHAEVLAQGLRPSGPPFCLYYDDPGSTPVGELRSRACIPIGGARSPQAPLRYEVLPGVTVAYAFVSGHYPDVPQAYPHLFAFLQRMNWVENGPVREIYMVPPGLDPDPASLLTEIQVPATQGQ